jgi:rhamnogalacturonyl hydrolase YesR
MGVAVLLANQTLQNGTYAQAAADEAHFQINMAPRAYNGAISHRVSEVQLVSQLRPRVLILRLTLPLWSDNAYMNPPFLAYYGAWTGDVALLLEAKMQIGLYREVLRDPSTKLWRHVLLGSWNETSFWGTGMHLLYQGGLANSTPQEMPGSPREALEFSRPC